MDFSAYSPFPVLRPIPHYFPRYLDDDSRSLHSQSSAPLTFAVSILLHTCPSHESVLGQASYSFTFHKWPKLASSLIHPTSDVRRLWNLTLLLLRTHPLTSLSLSACFVVTFLTDLTRDNHIFPFAILDLIVLFSLAGPFFVILNRRASCSYYL